MSVKPEPDTDPIGAAGSHSLGTSPPTHVHSHDTVPGPPISDRTTSLARPTGQATWHGSGALCNPYNVDLVIPFDISLKGKKDRKEEIAEVREGYELLIRALEGEGGLRVGTKSPLVEVEGKEGGDGKKSNKGKEEVWVFVGVGEGKMRELVDRER